MKHSVKYAILSIIFLWLLGPINQANGQEMPDSIAIFSGAILTADSLKPIENTHIISKFNRWGTISNEHGQFKMYVSRHDSLLITSVGYRPIILHVQDSMLNTEEPYPILMYVDTISINEVVIRAFWDYQTFKLIVSTMEPVSIDQFYPDERGTGLLYKQPVPDALPIHPIQFLYDKLNKDARLSRKLIKIRHQYNDLMIQMGRPEDTIPAMPEHMQVSPH